MTDQVPVPQAAADAAIAAVDGLTWAFAGDEADAITLAARRRLIRRALEAAAPAIRGQILAEQRELLTARPGAPEMDDHERALYWQAKAHEAAARLSEIEDGPDEHAGALLAALRSLYDTWQDKVVPVESAEHGYHGISYEDVAAMDDAADAVRLLEGEDRG